MDVNPEKRADLGTHAMFCRLLLGARAVHVQDGLIFLLQLLQSLQEHIGPAEGMPCDECDPWPIKFLQPLCKTRTVKEPARANLQYHQGMDALRYHSSRLAMGVANATRLNA